MAPCHHLLTGLVFFELFFFNFSTASCNEDQRKICLQAVSEKRLNWLSTGGECISKQYVQYTHLCTVYNYFPSVDYCCCHLTTNLMSSVSQKIKRSSEDLAIERNISRVSSHSLASDSSSDHRNESNEREEKDIVKGGKSGRFEQFDEEDEEKVNVEGQLPNAALCCRYHQHWDNFRCLESEDALIPSPIPTTQRLLNRFKSSDFYVGGLVLLAFIFLSLGVVCVLKMWKYKRLRMQEEKEWIEKDAIKKEEKKAEVLKEAMKKKKDSKLLSPTKISPSKTPAAIQYHHQPSDTAVNLPDVGKNDNLKTFSEEDKKEPSVAAPATDQSSLSKYFVLVRGSTTSDYFSYFDYYNAHNFYADSLENDSFSSCRNDTSDCSSYSSGETSEEPERHPYYSFYRRRVLGLDTRQPPCATNNTTSYGGKNGLHRHYRRHSRHNVNFRHHQLKRQRHLSYCPPSSTFLDHSVP